MAIYYSAYLGKKTKEGLYEIIGPYTVTNDGKMTLQSMWWRSQSFIRWREWDAMSIPIDKLGETAAKTCTVDGFWDEDKKYSIGYWISARDIYGRGSCNPIRGYLPIDEAAALIASGYNQNYISWSMESKPISSEAIAGMTDEKRSEYSFVSYIDYESTEYHMWELGRILNGYEEYTLLNDGEELGVIFQVG